MFHTAHCKHSYPEKANLSYAGLCNRDYMDSLAKKIRDMRTAKGLTQAALGKACSVSRVAVTKWENGDTENIKLANLKALAKTLEVSIASLLDVAEPAGSSIVISEPPASDYVAEVIRFNPDDPLKAELAGHVDKLNDRGMILLIETAEQLAARFPKAKAKPAN